MMFSFLNFNKSTRGPFIVR